VRYACHESHCPVGRQRQTDSDREREISASCSFLVDTKPNTTGHGRQRQVVSLRADGLPWSVGGCVRPTVVHSLVAVRMIELQPHRQAASQAGRLLSMHALYLFAIYTLAIYSLARSNFYVCTSVLLLNA